MDAFYETSLTKGIIGLIELSIYIYIYIEREREREREKWCSNKNFSCNTGCSLILNEKMAR